eukprot:TRINITY_DN12752_c0_g1_i1.p1 TRINITY_DN12752_c0_g1~~TRINITY_DN12752_c0_g1_i1.p1  ORF type:complete len:478 (+),score=122.87 TRINITY_DN12752_c0_g1_i1:54-1487(+)
MENSTDAGPDVKSGDNTDIGAMRERLNREIDEFKRVDMETWVKLAITYRQNQMALHEAGMKLATELQRMGEKYPQSKYGVELARRGADQEVIEKDRFLLQAAFWDNTILPMMTTNEADPKETQLVEKKVKANSSALDAKAKKEKKDFQKANKKGNGDESALQETMKEITSNHERVDNYFSTFKDQQYHKWTKHACASFDASSSHFTTGFELLKARPWKSIIEAPLEELPAEINFSQGLIPQQLSTSSMRLEASQPASPRGRPTLTRIESKSNVSAASPSSPRTPSPRGDYIKVGILTKRGEKRKNWKRRWFALTSTSLQYYKKNPQESSDAKTLGVLTLAEVTSIEENSTMKKTFCWSMALPHRTYYMHADTKPEMDEWLEMINKVKNGDLPDRSSTIDARPVSPRPASALPPTPTSPSPASPRATSPRPSQPLPLAPLPPPPSSGAPLDSPDEDDATLPPPIDSIEAIEEADAEDS